MSSVAQFVSC